ncbi:MAG: transposase [Candidatus Magnetoglobus multicellularis str. Araruama]|uniref:Transposase n=1 Tax=Candidatus Magnetoglobus multicellularis str. Araruama TaxID=890399 RepID=A0A1V1NXK7_9BACT|nr:MAG: transposase [Candidatus Magnetoglobus multicellularis str. Araruama]
MVPKKIRLETKYFKQMLLPGMFEPVIEDPPILQTIPSLESSSIKKIIEMYLNKHWSYNSFSQLYNVLICGTGKLGYHIDVCDNCASSRSMPNLCDHSLCPYCQKRLSENWIKNRISELLPVPYYQIVFKLPNKLGIFAMCNKKIVFDILFAAVATAMKKQPNQDDIKIGFIMSLQTCAANLWFWPHIHVCMPGIGIMIDEKLIQYSSKKTLPLTEEILSKEFRDSFIAQLEKIYEEKNVETEECEDLSEYIIQSETEKEIDAICADNDSAIKWPKELEHLAKDQSEFKKWIEELKNEKWGVDIGEPTKKDPKELIRYAGERLAISDEQIVEADESGVLFIDKRGEYQDLTLEEFIRRYVCHAMPKGYHRIRNCGFLGNNVKDKTIEKILSKFGKTDQEKPKKIKKCKQCETGHMQTVAVILGGETVKTFPEKIEKLKMRPSWLSILQEIESSDEITADLKARIPTWLIELIQSVD